MIWRLPLLGIVIVRLLVPAGTQSTVRILADTVVSSAKYEIVRLPVIPELFFASRVIVPDALALALENVPSATLAVPALSLYRDTV